MKHKISQMFCLKKSRKTKRNLTPIYSRITIKGERYEEAIHRQVEISEWSKILNGYLKEIAELSEIHKTFVTGT